MNKQEVRYESKLQAHKRRKYMTLYKALKKVVKESKNEEAIIMSRVLLEKVESDSNITSSMWKESLSKIVDSLKNWDNNDVKESISSRISIL